tara:strand:- start:2058 stop:2543 length:486 start_codon:yes stop_codon:yes gene_type:complete
MPNFKIEYYLKSILIISFISIITAYYIEYILGHKPCNLCLIERIPYVISIFIILTKYIFKIDQKFVLLLLTLTFSFSFFISIYHLGIEQGVFNESAVCGLKNTSDIISKEELLKLLNEKSISCKDVTFRVFGFSLTSINMILSLTIVIILIKINNINEKIR